MNILFIGPYYQNDGWGNAAKEYIRAISTTKHNLSIRPIYLNQQRQFEDLNEFFRFEKPLDKYDCVIQNCLPDMFVRVGGVKNIGLSYFETTIKHTPWVKSINLMDEVWVPSMVDRGNLLDSGVTAPINVVQIPTNLEKYKLNVEPFFLRQPSYRFLFVGEYISRKNIRALVEAFYTEFAAYEDVELVIKTNLGGADEKVLYDRVEKDVLDITGRIGYKSAGKITIITSRLTDHQMYSLYKNSDCFVMPSSGESFCIPILDAAGFGCSVIVNGEIGMPDISGMHLCDSIKYLAIAEDRPLPYLYNGRDFWNKIDQFHLMDCMREVYSRRNEKRSVPDLTKFSYDSVGQLIGECLES